MLTPGSQHLTHKPVLFSQILIEHFSPHPIKYQPFKSIIQGTLQEPLQLTIFNTCFTPNQVQEVIKQTPTTAIKSSSKAGISHGHTNIQSMHHLDNIIPDIQFGFRSYSFRRHTKSRLARFNILPIKPYLYYITITTPTIGYISQNKQ